MDHILKEMKQNLADIKYQLIREAKSADNGNFYIYYALKGENNTTPVTCRVNRRTCRIKKLRVNMEYCASDREKYIISILKAITQDGWTYLKIKLLSNEVHLATKAGFVCKWNGGKNDCVWRFNQKGNRTIM